MADKTTKLLLAIIAAALVVIAANMTMPAAADRQIVDVNILKVGDRFIGTAVPVTK